MASERSLCNDGMAMMACGIEVPRIWMSLEEICELQEQMTTWILD